MASTESGMTRQYEATFVFKTGANGMTRGAEIVRNRFRELDIKVINEDDMGERTLAYQVKKEDRGHYISFEVESEAESIQQIDRSLLVPDEILKFLVVRKDERAKSPA